MALVTGSLFALGASHVSASTSAPAQPVPGSGVPPRASDAVGGFSNGPPDADVVYADGSVAAVFFPFTPLYGDASGLALNAPVVGGAAVPPGRCENGRCGGYWLVGADGGVFTFGPQGFFGSMAGTRLNQPVVGIAATRSGKGYILVARDGGVFTLGDALFRGSAATLRLSQPVVGIATSTKGGPPHPAYKGYRLLTRDGGVFSYGGAPFFGSLPGRGIITNEAVAMVPTLTNKGYWIVLSDGRVYDFGDAEELGSAKPPPCDPITAIIGNPRTQGYRLVSASGATYVFGGLGDGLGGNQPTGTPRQCPAPIGPRPRNPIPV